MAFDQCVRYGDEAAAFVLGDVPAELRSEMVAHLETCNSCRREVAALNTALDSISAATVPVAPRPGFVAGVLAAAEAQIGLTPERDPRPVVRAPVTVVMRRRRTLLSLSAATALLSIIAVGAHSWLLSSLAIFCAVLDVSYLALVIAITHTKAREELASGLAPEDPWWRELEPVVPVAGSADEVVVAPVVAVDNTALLRFLASYFAGWLLTPVVALIGLVRGDLSGIEQSSPVLARIVALQRQGRAQSLRLLAAGATTVAVAGGGTVATMVIAPGVASAATSAQTYSVRAGDTLSTIAQSHGVSVSYLAQLNCIPDPNFILPGEIIRLGRGEAAGAASGGRSYTVRAGDTLDAIAARFGTTVGALAAVNHIADPNLIEVGQTLVVGGSAGGAVGTSSGSAAARPRTYTVRAGDTLDAIAARFGTTVGALAAVNHIADPNLIEVGQVLTLAGPGTGAGTAPPRTSPSTAPRSSTPARASAPAPAAPATSGYVNPFAYGNWSPARIDEGVDWIPNTVSPVVAIGNGVITYSSMNSGWPAGGFISYRLTSGSHAGNYIYVAEHITNLLPAGTVVRAGQQIATALPGYPWTEWGWASGYGPEPAPSAQYGSQANGTATPGGRAFARFLMSLGVTGIENPGPGTTYP